MSSSLYHGWHRQVWRKEDADLHTIQMQKYFIGILAALCTAFFIGWLTAPSRLTIYIPPDIQNGATVKAGSIPEPLIYSFAYEIWQELNYWPDEEGEAYQTNIHRYWAYLTPQFKADLLNEQAELKVLGQTQRMRYLQGLSGSAYMQGQVKKIGSSTWEVDLKMRLTEFKNNQVIKDVEIIYPLKISQVNVSPQSNPYGLVLAGFVSEPERQKTHL